jgi:hypothetical protein
MSLRPNNCLMSPLYCKINKVGWPAFKLGVTLDGYEPKMYSMAKV